MRKLLSLIALMVLVGAGIWLARVHSSKPAPQTVQVNVYKKACDVFTPQVARAVLGDGVTQAHSQTDTITAQKSVTTCLYSYDPGSLSDLVSASLLLQGAPPAQSLQSFQQARPDNAQTVKGYGDQAFWDPSLGQLNIVKGSYWLIISAGSGPINQRQADLPRRIADIIMKQI